MNIDTEKLLKLVRDAEIKMGQGAESGQIPLGHVDGVDYQLIVTRKPADFMARNKANDAIT